MAAWLTLGTATPVVTVQLCTRQDEELLLLLLFCCGCSFCCCLLVVFCCVVCVRACVRVRICVFVLFCFVCFVPSQHLCRLLDCACLTSTCTARTNRAAHVKDPLVVFVCLFCSVLFVLFRVNTCADSSTVPASPPRVQHALIGLRTSKIHWSSFDKRTPNRQAAWKVHISNA